MTRQQAMECFRIAAGRLAALTPEEKAVRSSSPPGHERLLTGALSCRNMK